MLSFSLDEFKRLIPSEFKLVQEVLKRFGLIPTLVGGTVRDFLLDSRVGVDWDIELRHPVVPFSLNFWKDITKELKNLGQVTTYPYHVLKMHLGDYSFEFSPPRKEIFKDHLSHLGHKNFDVEFDFKMPFETAILRRDFTINAMGISFKNDQLEFLDPLGGLKDLENGVLENCSADFIKDPVRFLRAHRFALKFDFVFSKRLSSLLGTMNLETISASYIWTEMQKSKRPWTFYETILEGALNQQNLKLPRIFQTDVMKNSIASFLLRPQFHFSWIVAIELGGGSAEEWVQYFHFSTFEFKKIKNWIHLSHEVKKMNLESFKIDFEEVLLKENFHLFYEWYFSTKQMMKKYKKYDFSVLLNLTLPEMSGVFQFELVSNLSLISPEKRSLYQVWNLCQRL